MMRFYRFFRCRPSVSLHDDVAPARAIAPPRGTS
jgi:hypothetical protein